MTAVTLSTRPRAGAVPAAQPRGRGRHPGDGLRVVLGLLILGLTSLAVQRDQLTLFERDLFRLVNNLPAVMGGVVLVVMQAGNLVAGPTAAAVALATRARRVALDLVVAGPIAWLAAKGVKRLMERPRPGGLLDDVQRYETSAGLGFVSGHTAVAAALATVASPYLPRRWRWVVWGVAWSVGFARIYEGAHLPLDVVGGAALGWAVGASVLVLLGAPHRIPTIDQARAAMARAGFAATAVSPVPGTPQGSFPFVATVDGRPVFVKLLDPEPRNRDLLFRVARFLMVRDVRDEAALNDAAAQAEHEAAMTLLARQAGVRAPVIMRVERVRRQVWLIEEAIDGTALAHLTAGDVPPGLLQDVWAQVAELHRAGIAHRDLVAGNVVVDAAGKAWLVDLAHATTSFRSTAADNDVAELLVATAAIVGADRAVAAAVDVLGAERVSTAAGELQPLALTAEGRRTLRAHRTLLADLHAVVASLAPAGSACAEAPLPRWAAWRVAVAAAAVVGATLGVAGAAGVATELTTGSWRWAGASVFAAALLQLHRASGVAAAARRPLGLGHTALACMAADAATIAGRADWPSRIGTSLARSGVVRAEAIAAGRRRASALLVVVSVALAVAIAGVVVTGTTWRWSNDVAVLAAAAVLSSAVAPPSRGLGPRRWAPARELSPVLLTAVAAEVATGATVLAGAVKTVGGSAAVWAVLLVAVAAMAVAVLVPRLGLGIEATVAAGGLVAAGLPASTAVAAVVLWCATVRWVPALVAVVLRPMLARRLVV